MAFYDGGKLDRNVDNVRARDCHMSLHLIKSLSLTISSPAEGGAESLLGLASGSSPGLRVRRLVTWSLSVIVTRFRTRNTQKWSIPPHQRSAYWTYRGNRTGGGRERGETTTRRGWGMVTGACNRKC